jgi:hypothetical protein
MAEETKYRREGRYVTAVDVAERLLPDLDINEVILWSPDLFAYTAYLLNMNSAYQLVVSPPSKRKWQPDKDDIVNWLCVNPDTKEIDDGRKNITDWYDKIKVRWKGTKDFKFDAHFKAIEEWRTNTPTEEDLRKKYELKLKRKRKTDRKVSHWEDLVRTVAEEWRQHLDEDISEEDFKYIDDNVFKNYEDRKNLPHEKLEAATIERERRLLDILLNNTPPLLLACWAFFYKQITNENFENQCQLQVADLLCNQDHLQRDKGYCDRLWDVSQSLLTMHAIADVTSVQFGIVADTGESGALRFAEMLLFGRPKYNPKYDIGGSLATYNTERCRVLPKRHNPAIGITLRSLSSNLAFHQSAVDVVWRKTLHNTLGERLLRSTDDEKKKNLSLLLLPFPLTVKAKDFGEDGHTQKNVVKMSEEYSFFSYEPYPNVNDIDERYKQRVSWKKEVDLAVKLIVDANKELPDDSGVDIIIFPETALSLQQYELLQLKLKENFKENKDKFPSIIIAGVRESRQELAEEVNKRTQLKDKTYTENDFNFPRNAVYCQYFDKTGNNGEGSYYNLPTEHSEATPKYKQYKHHRWQLERSQIRRYGLSSVLDSKKMWWESIKIPKRRVSLLNVGDRITISHLICEDLARQDPIAELVRHVGPSLVVTILMDGPQLRSRWSARYATVLSDDPGSSVITLTSLGMVKRHQSEHGLMSRVVALWNESSAGHSREIELAPGAEAVLLSLWIDEIPEKTADGREETIATSVVRLNDVIQIYPGKEK